MNGSNAMVTATNVTQWIVRLTGMTQVALGLLFWSGRALGLMPLHMVVGVSFVVALWVLAGIAARLGVGRALVLLAVGWGVLVPAFGIVHARLLPGASHWIARVLHLLIGFVAMAIAARLAGLIRADAGLRGWTRPTTPVGALEA